MPRPRKWRRVCRLPQSSLFGPLGGMPCSQDSVTMTVDEFETIRLIDLEGLTQEECAVQMNIARTTVQAMYNQARTKLAQSLVEGRLLRIEGGEYRLCDADNGECGRCGCPRCRRIGE